MLNIKKICFTASIVALFNNVYAQEPNLNGKTFQLQSMGSKNCIQLEGNNTEEGTKLIQYPCEANNPLQTLTFTKNGDYYNISFANGNSINIAGESKSNGINAVQSVNSGLFKIIFKDDGFTLQPQHSKKYLSTTSYNTDIVQEATNKLPNQIWNVYMDKIYKSCKEILDAGKDIGDGIYLIDPDAQGEAFEAYCDMTTDGGGWTEIIKDHTTSLTHLENFGDTSHISSTFYTDSTKGIGWGTNDQFFKEFKIKSLIFTQMKITISGNYNNPIHGLGFLFITDSSYQGKYWDQSEDSNFSLYFNDGQTDPTKGQYLSINAEEIIKGQPIDVLNQTYILNSYHPYINITGYKSTSPYTKRYIGKLLVR